MSNEVADEVKYINGERILIAWPQHEGFAVRRGVFVCYRTPEEMKEWRPDDNCWVLIDGDFGRRAYETDLIVKAPKKTPPPPPRERPLGISLFQDPKERAKNGQ